MRARKESGLKNIDWTTFSIFLSLIAVGWLMIFTVGYEEGSYDTLASFMDAPVGKQTIWIGICFVVFIAIFLIDWKFWQTFSYPLYALALVLLVAVLFFGQTIKGATSWFVFGGFSFQPSEIAKFATCLALAGFLSSYSTNLKDLRSQIISFGLFMTPMVLILLQRDAGSALIFLSFLIVLYREGLSANYYIIGIIVTTILLLGLVYNPVFIIIGLIFVCIYILTMNFPKNRSYWFLGTSALALAAYFGIREGYMWYTLYACIGGLTILGIYHLINNKVRLVAMLSLSLTAGSALTYGANYAFNNILQPHQQDRINVWLRPELCDPKGSLYNVLQSKLAISAGGLQGKGFMEGKMTKLNYVPEQITDFIFCTIGEEQGFIGSVGIIGLFLLLLLRITIIADRQRSNFSRQYAYGVAGIIFLHFFINIGMTMGIMPIIGIPLPFISKGGSSLLGFTIMISVLLKLDSNRYTI
jgi:rod shape determining protein RodA